MNLQYFYNYVTIVEEGSLTAASKKLHVAQPALSNQIKAMEQKYGTRLFFRGARRLELTDAGMILYRKAKSICEIEQAAQNEILSGFSGQQGMLRVGVTPSVAHGRITDVLLDFAQKYPQIEIKYLEAGPMDLCKMLQNGVIEVAVLKTMGDLPENVHVIATDVAPTVALYDPKAGLLNEVIGDTVTIEQLSNVPLAMEEQYLIPVQNAFKQKGAQLYLKALSSSPYVSAKIAVAGLAVGLVSAHVAYSGLLAGMTVKPIQDGGALTGQYCIAVQQGNYRSQVVNNFLEIVTDAFGLKLIDEPSAPANQEEI